MNLIWNISLICVLLQYLLKEKEILNAVHGYAVSIQQAVEFETQFPLGFRRRLFCGDAGRGTERVAKLGLGKHTLLYKWENKNLKPRC